MVEETGRAVPPHNLVLMYLVLCFFCCCRLQFPYICAVVSEALRLYPPGANTLRETNDDPFQLGPYTLPARTTLVVSTYVMQRDPAIWPEAAAFKPERWLPVRQQQCRT